MRNSVLLLGIAIALTACSQSGRDNAAAGAGANTAAAPERPAYCFFKDSETKAWKASTDRSGNVVVSGKAYRADPRYKVLLGPAKVSGATAELAPTINVNDTGYAAPEDWWTVSETIPHSEAVTSVTVRCGDKTVATLDVRR